MKKLLLSLAITTSLAISAHAQDATTTSGGSTGGTGGGIVSDIKDTHEQLKDNRQEAGSDAKNRIQNFKQDKNQIVEAGKEERDSLKSQYESDLAAAQTPEEKKAVQEKYKNLRSEKRSEFKDKMQANRKDFRSDMKGGFQDFRNEQQGVRQNFISEHPNAPKPAEVMKNHPNFRNDVQDVRQDRRALAKDVAGGAGKKEIKGDVKDLRSDRKDVRHDVGNHVQKVRANHGRK